MAGKKRTTAMELAWVKAQKEKQRKAKSRDEAKNRKDSAAVRKKYKNKKSKQNMLLLAIMLLIQMVLSVMGKADSTFFYYQCNILDIMYRKECDNINVP